MEDAQKQRAKRILSMTVTSVSNPNAEHAIETDDLSTNDTNDINEACLSAANLNSMETQVEANQSNIGACSTSDEPMEQSESVPSPANEKKRKVHDALVFEGHKWHVSKIGNGGETIYYDCSQWVSTIYFLSTIEQTEWQCGFDNNVVSNLSLFFSIRRVKHSCKKKLIAKRNADGTYSYKSKGVQHTHLIDIRDSQVKERMKEAKKKAKESNGSNREIYAESLRGLEEPAIAKMPKMTNFTKVMRNQRKDHTQSHRSHWTSSCCRKSKPHRMFRLWCMTAGHIQLIASSCLPHNRPWIFWLLVTLFTWTVPWTQARLCSTNFTPFMVIHGFELFVFDFKSISIFHLIFFK